MNRVEEHTFKKNGWLGAEQHHGSSHFSFIAFETELQCHGVVPSTYLLKRHGFNRFCHHPDGISAFMIFFSPHEMKQHGLTAWLAFLLMYWLLRYQKFYKNIQPEFRRNAHTIQSSLLFSCLEKSSSTSSLVTLLPQQWGIFSNSREQWSKPCCGWSYYPLTWG